MVLKKAREVLKIEAKAIEALAKRIDNNFVRAVDVIMKCKGRVIVTGCVGLISFANTKKPNSTLCRDSARR